ncbi:MAG: hypothetical protein AB7V08_14290 [Elusimicrobiales bacterium]
MDQPTGPGAADDTRDRWQEYERRKQTELETNPDPQALAAFCRALAEELKL